MKASPLISILNKFKAKKKKMSFTRAQETVAGYVSINHNLKYYKKRNVVVRSDFESIPLRQVRLISGGGGGHEPTSIGYIGKGEMTIFNRICLLNARGSIFTLHRSTTFTTSDTENRFFFVLITLQLFFFLYRNADGRRLR